MEKYSLFHIEGGLGKHVAATAVAKCIKNNHPDRKLIVVCAYPEVYLNLRFVDRVYRIGNTPYFYNDYIKDKNKFEQKLNSLLYDRYPNIVRETLSLEKYKEKMKEVSYPCKYWINNDIDNKKIIINQELKERYDKVLSL